jgi:serine/threonine-protein kinase
MTDSLYERVVAATGHQYELDGEIGRGGMSVVYRARDLRLNRPVAIKVLPPELAHDPAIRTRFTREAQTSALLSHAHIVPIHDVDEREGIAYFVMALVGGGNLAALLAREPRQPVERVRRILCEVSDALAYAHLRGVIHRDIKPDNILLDGESGRAMVTDFGIARAIEAGTRLTLTGIAVGTPTYMSPEQAMGEREIDGRSDLYSLGVVAYQMLTGRVPFTAGNSMALLMKHVTEPPKPIAELRADVPKSLREAIERALMKEPEDRWPTAATFRDALTSAEPPGSSWRGPTREPVRYTSPRPESARRDRQGRGSARAEQTPASPRRGLAAVEAHSDPPARLAPPGGVTLEPEHLATLTAPQRADLRLWHGRVNLMDRIKAARGYALFTAGMWFAGIAGFVGGIEEVPPLVLSPIVPMFMSMKLWRRGKSLRESGLKLRRVFLMPRARWVIPAPPPVPGERQLEKLASRELLDSLYGAAIRRAADDRSAILEIVAKLPKGDRALLPDLAPTVNGLVERVAHLAQMIHRLEQSIDPRLIEELDMRIAEVERESESAEGERRLTLLRRQRGSFEELVQRRASLARQLDNAGLMLGNLRLDLVRFRSSGLQSALSDVSTATQEARALSSEIGAMLEAAAEVRGL